MIKESKENKKSKDKVLKIIAVKTNIGCFISDCLVTSGYDYEYHHPKIEGLYFDSKKATGTFYPNWFFIEKYPEKIERLCEGKTINIRYEIDDKNNITKALPAIIPYEESEKYSGTVLDSLYTYKYDTEPDYLEEIDVDIKIVFGVDNMKEIPHLEYSATQKSGWNEVPYKITNADVKHQLFDKMIFPEVLLYARPCKLTSKQMYDITRQYIKDHINKKWAEITSDYDFCFEVAKIIPLLEPETIEYQNIFARTKKERNKTHFQTRQTKKVKIFSMTHNQENYRGYTAIGELSANSEAELKEKVDLWLEGLIEQINKPLCQCPYCEGTGYQDEVVQIDKNKIIGD